MLDILYQSISFATVFMVSAIGTVGLIVCTGIGAMALMPKVYTIAYYVYQELIGIKSR